MNETDANFTNAPRCSANEKDSTEVKAIKTILFISVFLLASFGNVFIVTVVYKTKSMRKTTNIFIANMAASDMFVALVTIPRLLTDLYVGDQRWLLQGTLGVITCKFCHFCGDFSFCISILSHTAIAVDRFWAIVHSLRPSPITPSRRKYIIAIIWLFSFILNSTTFHSVGLINKDGRAYCVMNWEPLPANSQKIHSTIIFVVMFCIPALVIFILYMRLIKSITGQKDVSFETSQLRKRRKEDIAVLRKVAVLVILFFFSVTPMITLLMLTQYLWGQLPCTQAAWTFSFVAFFLYLSNCAANPCACIILNKTYRHHIRKMITCLTESKTPETHKKQTNADADRSSCYLVVHGQGISGHYPSTHILQASQSLQTVKISSDGSLSRLKSSLSCEQL